MALFSAQLGARVRVGQAALIIELPGYNLRYILQFGAESGTCLVQLQSSSPSVLTQPRTAPSFRYWHRLFPTMARQARPGSIDGL